MFVCVTGVSGSGKSTLVSDILSKKAAQLLYGSRDRPGECDAIVGLEHLDKVVVIDQSPIGRTPRSNPATYTGLFTPIRELFASVPEARLRGYGPGRFSFNVKGGRCEACQGDGYIEIEMQFLPDVEVPCEVCHGARYNREALEILFKGKNIAEVLDMTVEEALEFFAAFGKVHSKLETLHDVGLGYIKLGQPATTLSGGEAQRVKLATELSRRATGRTLYILDEPTTGLSFEDVNALMGVLHRLVDTGNTVLVIEHHIDVIKQADHIIDLGPLGGDKGGEIVAEGTPEQIARSAKTATGKYLRRGGGGVKEGEGEGGEEKKAGRKKKTKKGGGGGWVKGAEKGFLSGSTLFPPQIDSCSEGQWTTIFNGMIKPAIEGSSFGYECRRSSASTGNLIKGIVQDLYTANLVVADLTDKRPNVFYELGVRHTLQHRTILISQRLSDIPSDLHGYACLEYDWQTDAGQTSFASGGP